MGKIELYGVSHDPFAEATVEATVEAAGAPPGEARYLLIESAEPWGARHWRALAAVGVRCLERVGDWVYLCAGDGADLPTVRSLDFVVAAAPYSRRFKLAEELEPAAFPGPEAAARRPSTVDVELHADADARFFATRLAEGGVEVVDAGGRTVRLRADPAALEAVAGQEQVRRIEPAPSYEFCSNEACQLIGATRVHRDLGLRGEGEIIGICDSGLDKGVAGDVHPAFAGRVAKLIALKGSRKDDPNGHGTHVAGLALGDGSSVEAPGAITGVAPAAKLVMQAAFKNDGLERIPSDLDELFRPVFESHGVRVHNNSWIEAGKRGGFYSKHSGEIDEFVHGHRDLVVVCATGNRGVPGDVAGSLAPRTVRPPATAKNCIAVGACESPRPRQDQTWGTQRAWTDTRFDSDPEFRDDGWSDDPDRVAPFSGCGPASHDRIRPDLVAPGTVALAPRSRALRRPRDLFGASTDAAYRYSGGTSAAAPIVAGCAAIVRQHLKARLGRDPSAALVKAVLINSADDLGGAPANHQGWGRVNLERAVATALPERLEFHDEGTVLATGETDVRNLLCLEGGLTLKVTLVWSDPRGEHLQCDLDLIVERDQEPPRHGNQPAGSTEFDRDNNVEQIVWPSFPAGPFRIGVHAHHTLPGGQTFALVVRGGI